MSKFKLGAIVFQDSLIAPGYTSSMKINTLPHAVPRSLGGLKSTPPQDPQGPRDGFQPSEPPSNPVWKKLANSAAWGVAGATTGAIGTVMVGGALVSGPDALGVLFFAPAGAAVGAIAGAVIGYQMMNR